MSLQMEDTSDAYVMLSYQWDRQAEVIKLRDYLKEQNIKVWIDIDNMGNDLYESMAQAVDNAALVILCLTSKYEKSKNCQREYKMAADKGDIIPVHMEENFSPTKGSALRAIVTGQIYVDLSGQKFENNLPELRKKVIQFLKTGSTEGQDEEHDQNTSNKRKNNTRSNLQVLKQRRKKAVSNTHKEKLQGLLHESRVKSIICGDADVILPRNEKLVRVFLASSHEDMDMERHHVLSVVYPRLVRFCESLGYDFQFIDLPYGVDDHSKRYDTRAVIREEITKCYEISTGPFMVVLLGENYGRLLTHENISTEIFSSILSNFQDEKEKQKLLDWYQLDSNCSPATYKLLPREQRFPDISSSKEIQETCTFSEQTFGDALSSILNDIDISELERLQYSQTEIDVDVRFALSLSSTEAKERILCFERQFTDTPDDDRTDKRLLTRFVEEDEERKKLLNDLKGTLKQENKTMYRLKWSVGAGLNPRNEQHAEYIEKLGEDVYTNLSSMINRRIEKDKSSEIREDIVDETSQHVRLWKDKASNYHGNKPTLGKVKSYLAASDDVRVPPLIIHGESGSDKTSFLAKAASIARNNHKDCRFIVRFLGTTSRSSDIRSALRSVCEQLLLMQHSEDVATTDEELEVPQDYKQLCKFFIRMLTQCSVRTFIFLDALDDLSAVYRPHELEWLPKDRLLPTNAKLVMTTRSGEQYQMFTAFQSSLDSAQLIPIPKLTPEETSVIIDSSLEFKSRCLTSTQKQLILDRYDKCASPFYLKLVIAESYSWQSFETETSLGDTITAIIDGVLDRVEKKFGKLFVNHCIGLLTVSCHGLSDCEMEDLLRISDMRVVGSSSLSMWIMLRGDLRHYLEEKSMDGALVHSWFHRQFEDAVRARYLSSSEEDARFRRIIVQYFDGEEDNGVVAYSGVKSLRTVTNASHRKLKELPKQLLKLGDADLMKRLVLFNYEFLSSKLQRIGIGSVIDEYRQAASRFPLHDDVRLMLACMESSKMALAGSWTNQLATQLVGRLQGLNGHLYLEAFLTGVNTRANEFLRPSNAFLGQPSLALVKTIVLPEICTSMAKKLLYSQTRGSIIRIPDESGCLWSIDWSSEACQQFDPFADAGGPLTGNLLSTLSAGRFHDFRCNVQVSTDEKWLVYASWDGKITLRDVNAKKENVIIPARKEKNKRSARKICIGNVFYAYKIDNKLTNTSDDKITLRKCDDESYEKELLFNLKLSAASFNFSPNDEKFIVAYINSEDMILNICVYELSVDWTKEHILHRSRVSGDFDKDELDELISESAFIEVSGTCHFMFVMKNTLHIFNMNDAVLSIITSTINALSHAFCGLYEDSYVACVKTDDNRSLYVYNVAKAEKVHVQELTNAQADVVSKMEDESNLRISHISVFEQESLSYICLSSNVARLSSVPGPNSTEGRDKLKGKVSIFDERKDNSECKCTNLCTPYRVSAAYMVSPSTAVVLSESSSLYAVDDVFNAQTERLICSLNMSTSWEILRLPADELIISESTCDDHSYIYNWRTGKLVDTLQSSRLALLNLEESFVSVNTSHDMNKEVWQMYDLQKHKKRLEVEVRNEASNDSDVSAARNQLNVFFEKLVIVRGAWENLNSVSTMSKSEMTSTPFTWTELESKVVVCWKHCVIMKVDVNDVSVYSIASGRMLVKALVPAQFQFANTVAAAWLSVDGDDVIVAFAESLLGKVALAVFSVQISHHVTISINSSLLLPDEFTGYFVSEFLVIMRDGRICLPSLSNKQPIMFTRDGKPNSIELFMNEVNEIEDADQVGTVSRSDSASNGDSFVSRMDTITAVAIYPKLSGTGVPDHQTTDGVTTLSVPSGADALTMSCTVEMPSGRAMTSTITASPLELGQHKITIRMGDGAVLGKAMYVNIVDEDTESQPRESKQTKAILDANNNNEPNRSIVMKESKACRIV